MIRSLLPLGIALLSATSVLAEPPACSLTQKCPEEAPCCSQYGQCGVGAFCLGGCDPRMSFGLDSCVPAPVCQDKTFKMDSLDRYKDISEYLGDSSEADWVGQGEPLLYNGNVLLTMAPKSVGTVLATTTYMWYGNVKAKIKTSRGRGVVTAFILFGDVKDEIDFEWVGTDLNAAQTNYYFQGIPNYDNSGNISVSSNTYDNFHEYEVRWTPDEITWLVDGKVGRTKKRSETWNATANQWAFPQTPTRVQISIWPGGLETNAKGTIDWAGGVIDWNSDEIKNYGYYFATFGEITVECYKATSGPGSHSKKSYYYNNIAATNDTVIDSDKPTVLKSFLGSGTNMDAGGDTPGGTAAGASPESIPGGSNQPGQVPGGGGSSDRGSSTSDTSSAAGCSTTGFSQTCGQTLGGKSGSVRGAERTLGASALAVVIGIAGLLFL
ncbi:glycoside hydrolase family 16 protein [Lasiosphaeris hirsuta]|uniref:Crh-like protein n=1 Tax=Lasiosphaeris hirsuta TaxID=260670 RepID=A0AA39ZVL2_9PEZI|nr:glycoside hydrolase family 16 protein [Lasiosphaeris hirsuta]